MDSRVGNFPPQVALSAPTEHARDLARRLFTCNISNLAQRVKRGENMSRFERAMLQVMAASSGSAQATVADNYVELAHILEVTWRSIQNWQKRSDAPKLATNGFHEMTAWHEFMSRHDMKGDAPTANKDTALRARKLLAAVAERELRLAVKKRE